MPQVKTLSYEDYTVGWICALPLELAAAKAMLDETHGQLPQRPGDDNTYTLGEVFGHNVVLAGLPAGIYGTTSATAVAVNMLSTYRHIRFGLMVGIGGGVPSKEHDIRLGDIVVSRPYGSSGGVVQYDYGKTIRGRQFEHTGTLDKPPQVLLTAVNNVQSNEILGKSRISEFLAEIPNKYPALSQFTHRNQENDHLYQAEYDHLDPRLSCEECKCNPDMILRRPARPNSEPRVFYGLIASGNQVMKHGSTRDRLAAKHGIICFEMEAAGLMDRFPCLVIRGICDYADSHKSKKWQQYAAATAAAYAKEILSVIAVASTQNSKKPFIGLGSTDFQMTDLDEECLRGLYLMDPEEDKNALKRRKGDRAPGTCKWILETQEIKGWLGDPNSNIMWLYGNPGTGKSTIAIALADWLPKSAFFACKKLAYFFCDSGSENRRTAVAVLRGLLYQLVQQQRELLQFFRTKYEAQNDKIFSSFDAMWSILLTIANDEPTGEKYCIIDALDECDRESQEILLTQIKHTFRSQGPTQSRPKLHILVTSRPYPEIARQLRLFNHKDLASYMWVGMDIMKLISSKVEELKRTQRYTENISQQVSKILLEKAQGTFLWVGIACAELSHVRSRDAVKALQKLPRGLDSLYQELLDTALDRNKDDHDTITQILSFVAISRQPLTIAQLSVACRSYDGYDEADRLAFIREDIEMCRLMITVQGDIVRLLHKSVKDFLLKDKRNQLIHDVKAHAIMANRCISHLLDVSKAAGGLMPNREIHGFTSYAVHFWPEHAHLAKTEFAILDEHLDFFGLASDPLGKWLELYNQDNASPAPLGFSIFHIAARWGIPLLIKFAASMLEMKAPSGGGQGPEGMQPVYDDSEFEASNGITPLGEAAKAGHVDAMELLLELGHPKMTIRCSVMEAAAVNRDSGHTAVELLLNRRGDGIEITETVLMHAAANTGRGEGIVETILRHRADKILVTKKVLTEAAENVACGQQVARLLLAHGRIPSPFDLELAKLIISRFDARAVRLLLDRAGEKFTISSELLVAAMRNLDALQVVPLLLAHDLGLLPLTEEVWEFIIHRKHQRIEMVRLLLGYKGSQLIFTERLAMAVASHTWETRKELMMAFVKGSYTEMITDKAVEIIARFFDAEVMEQLLGQPSRQVRVTETLMMAAARNHNKEHRESLVALLEERRLRHISTMRAAPMSSSLPRSDVHGAISQAKVLEGHADEVWVSAFSHNGLKLATGSRDGSIIFYDTADFATLYTIEGKPGRGITCLAWDKSDTMLATGSRDGRVLIWDIEGWKLEMQPNVSRHMMGKNMYALDHDLVA
ncbi:hypothetical protein BDV10DRAFT_182585 [Aspergillus recurvatus]